MGLSKTTRAVVAIATGVLALLAALVLSPATAGAATNIQGNYWAGHYWAGHHGTASASASRSASVTPSRSASTSPSASVTPSWSVSPSVTASTSATVSPTADATVILVPGNGGSLPVTGSGTWTSVLFGGLLLLVGTGMVTLAVVGARRRRTRFVA